MQNWFLLSNLISECLHTQIRCTNIFIQFLFEDKKWQWLQYCNFHQYQHIFRWNHPYAGEEVGWHTGHWLHTYSMWDYAFCFWTTPLMLVPINFWGSSDLFRKKGIYSIKTDEGFWKICQIFNRNLSKDIHEALKLL